MIVPGCRSLPRTGIPCELLNSTKKNPICCECGVRLGGESTNATQFERAEMAKHLVGKESMIERRSPGSGNIKKTKCGFIGCNELQRAKYCMRHRNVVWSRKTMWKAGKKRWPPEKWDRVPIGDNPDFY